MQQQNTPCRSVMLCGAYGADNLGDEALLGLIIAELRQLEPELNICVITRAPEDTAERYSVCAVHAFDFAAINSRLKHCDMLIFGGGSLIQDETSRRSLFYYLWVLRCAKRCGCTVMMYGCGIGPVNSERDRRLSARVLNSCVDAITLRDEKSADLLLDLGVTAPLIKIAADPLVSLDGCDEKTAEDFLIACGLDPDGAYALFAIRPWGSLSGRENALAAAVKYAYDELSLTPLFMTLNPGLDTPLAESIVRTAGVPQLILPPVSDASLAIGIMRKMRLVVSMRLHALLFAASAGTAAVGISYDPKVRGFAEYAGCTCIELSELSADALIECMASELKDFNKAERSARMEKIKAAERINLAVAESYIRREDI